MSARGNVLSRIRRALAVGPDDSSRRAVVAGRIANPPPGIIPARGQVGPAERLALFRHMAEKAHATVAEAAATRIPTAVADYLGKAGLPLAARTGSDARLAALPWSAAGITLTKGRSHGDDPVAIAHAEAGVAETGTVVLASGPDNPTTLNFLPATHIVVVRAADIVGDYESAWALLQSRHPAQPRLVNFITGPSRSADIEQTLLLGAHGPLRLHLIVTL